jgi:hypothetical protein
MTETAVATEERTFTTPEVARFVGATFRNLDYWVRAGWLRPNGVGAGSGVRVNGGGKTCALPWFFAHSRS